MKNLFIIFLCMTLFSCSEDKGNYAYNKLNDVVISGFKPSTINKGIYFIQHNKRLQINPTITQKLNKSEADLTYVWEIGKNRDTLSTEKNLDIIFPAADRIGFGTHESRFIVTDRTTGVEYVKTFKVQATTEFNFGYFILCRDNDNTTEVAYLSSIKDEDGNTPDQLLYTKKVGNIPLNGEPVAVTGDFGNIAALDEYFWTMQIITKDPVNPFVLTDCATFLPSSTVSANNFADKNSGYKFNPTHFMRNPFGEPFHYFLSNGQVMTYMNSVLYRPAKHTGNYYWSNIVFYWDTIYCFDDLTKKYYSLNPTTNDPANNIFGDPYAFDEVTPLINSEDYSDKFILMQKFDKYAEDGIVIVTGIPEGIRLDTLKANSDKKQAFFKSKVIPATGIDKDSKAVFSRKGNWYFLIGKTIFSSPNILPALSKFVDLPTDLGVVTDFKLGAKENDLILTFYDKNSPLELKGSMVIIDINSKSIRTYKNCMKEPVSLFCADESLFSD